jgi:general secretion pathway protein B
MSYILEALKMSERSRRQSAVATQYSLLPIANEREPGPSRRYPLLVGALLVNAVVIALWLRPSSPASAPAVPAPRPMPATAQSAAVVAPGADTQAAPASPPPLVPVRIAPLPSGLPRAADSSAAHPAPSRPIAETLVLKPAAGNTSASAPAKVEAVSEATTADGMPMSMHNQLPPIAVTGLMHDGEAHNLVIVNDRPLREGDEVSPGLTVEKILEHGVVFNFKGYRFKR